MKRSVEEGLTLSGLMVVLAILAILVTVVAPGVQLVLRKNQLQTQITEFILGLQLTRSEAVHRNRPVSICKSSDGISCGGASINWEDGWIVFANIDNDDPATIDPGEPIIRVQGPLEARYTLRPSASFARYVTYIGTGVPNAPGHFVLCREMNLSPSEAIFVNSAGRIRKSLDANQNGIPDIPESNPITDIASCTP